MTEQPSTDPLPSLSDHLARHVAAIGAGVVAVHGRPGASFSGFVWRRGAIVTAEEALEADEDITITVPDGRRIRGDVGGARSDDGRGGAPGHRQRRSRSTRGEYAQRSR